MLKRLIFSLLITVVVSAAVLGLALLLIRFANWWYKLWDGSPWSFMIPALSPLFITIWWATYDEMKKPEEGKDNG